ncbi:unnamed protein product [Rotaria magnacalcarata]|uniref:Uncharacterized protein n=8 Tax=Rotaria magnacalcarata TaxID=392030 RepID=A0A815YIK1_9BILA|nr:unnamed protein product [Rotaria magnacalcarata]CAF1966061.1 unnamed protein product [Rotaria magnacalcarata]
MEKTNKDANDSNSIRYKRELSRLRSIKHRNTRRDRCRPTTQYNTGMYGTSRSIIGLSTQTPVEKSSDVINYGDGDRSDISDHSDQNIQNFPDPIRNSNDIDYEDENAEDEDESVEDEDENAEDEDENAEDEDESVEDEDENVEDEDDDNDGNSNDLSINIIDEQQNEANRYCLDLTNFIRSSNLNKKNTNDLLKLVNSISSNKKLPRTEEKLWKQLGIEFNYKIFAYCTNCMALLNEFNARCNSCINIPSMINSEFILFSIEKELNHIIQMNSDFMKGYRPHSGGDLIYGNIYQSKSRKNAVTLILSTDGKPTTKNSRSSMWPVIATIAEIPLPIREYKENVVLLGLWHSPKSPSVEILLGRIMENINKLQINGFDTQLEVIRCSFHKDFIEYLFSPMRDTLFICILQNELLHEFLNDSITSAVTSSFFVLLLDVQHFDLDVLLFVGDLPARSKCCCINSCVGYYSCTHCLFDGVRCTEHQHTLFPWERFRGDPPKRRTQQHISECIRQIELSTKSDKIFGIISRSPLSTVLSMPDQIPFDYFHLCYEIHMPALMKHWMKILSKESKQCIDGYLSNISYPHSFNRYPRTITNFSQWKASEMRVFTLYVCLPSLVQLKNEFPAVIIAHFSLFFIYIRRLRFFDNQRDMESMIYFIEAYLDQYASLYSKCAELLSTHALIHLYEQSLNIGSLSSHSLFSTESYLHHLYKLAHGTVALAQQMAHWHTINRCLQATDNKFSSKLFETKKFLEKNFFNHNVKRQFKEEFKKCFVEYFGVESISSIKFYSRYQDGLIVYHSLSYTNKKKSSSYNVSIMNQSNARTSTTGQIIFFFEYNNGSFAFFKNLILSDIKFSSFIQTNDQVNQWNDYIDYYYYFVHTSSSSFNISLCTNINRKCLLLPFDNKFSLCTEIELELEHD